MLTTQLKQELNLEIERVSELLDLHRLAAEIAEAVLEKAQYARWDNDTELMHEALEELKVIKK